MLFFKERTVVTDSPFNAAFNAKAADVKIAQLTEEMTQAFYRREHDTIDSLAAKGARFTQEMLQVSVAFRDHHLAEKCMQHGVRPNEDMVKRAAAQDDAPLTDMLIRKIDPTPELKAHIEHFTSEMIQKTCAPYLAHLGATPMPMQNYAYERDAPRR